MKKFFTITLALIAVFMLAACSGKNLDDLIEIPDTNDTADSSERSDQNDTDNGGDTNADTTDSADSASDNGDSDSNNDTELIDDSESGNDTDPTDDPTTDPSDDPTTDPTDDPTTDPTDDPTTDPTDDPTTDPTDDPTTDPTDDPTTDPTDDPTTNPTDDPTTDPSDDPTTDPTDNPTTDPTDDPTTDPTDDPTTDPTDQDDTQRCTEITLTNTELNYDDHHSSLSYRYDIFKTTYTPNTGSATTDNFYLKFYGSEYNYSGDHELAGTNWKNDDGYSSGLFLYVHEDEYCDSYSGSCSHSKTYFQKAGTVNVTSAQFDSGKMYILYAELNGVVLEEVTINSSTGESVPVSKGACLKIQDNTQVEYHGYYY